MIFSIMVYIPTFLFLFIVLWGTFKGFTMGLRKSTILLINSAVAILLSLIVFLIIFKGDFDTRMIELTNKYGLDLKSILGTTKSYDSLSEYIRELVWDSIPQDYITSNGLLTIISTLMAIVESLVKVVTLLVLYFIYYIFKGLFFLFYLIFFKESRYKKKAKRELREGRREKEYKKNRGYGSLLGFGRGLCCALLTFSFIGSFFYILSGGYYSDQKQDIVIEVEGTKYDITEYYDIVNRYGTVGIGKILESVKTGENVPVYLLAADYLTKGDYTVGDDKNSLYGREELAPIVGFVKETAFLALDYGFDTSKVSDTDYLVWFLSTQNVVDNVCFSDKLETVVDKYDFGSYSLYLAQSLATAMADSVSNNGADMSFTSRLMHHLFKGENKIEAKNVINNENVDIILKLALNIVKNQNEINGFIDEFTPSDETPEEKLLFGVRKSQVKNSNNAKVFASVIEQVSNSITSLTFLQGEKANHLISDILIEVLTETMPDFSIENIKNKTDLCSIYNVKWNDGLKEVFDIAYDLVMFISDNEVKDINGLLDNLLLGEDCKATEFVNRLIGSDFAGVFFNANGFVELINEKLTSANIRLPKNLIYGNYYENGNLVKGEIQRLFDALDEKVPTVYQIYKDERMNVIGEWVSEDKGLLPLLSSILNESEENYSKLLHYTISDVLQNLKVEGFEIVIPSESINQENIIYSNELVNFVNVLIEAKISDLSTAPSSVNLQEFFIEKVVKLNDESQRSFVECKILNSTLVNFLETIEIEQGDSAYHIVLPNEALIQNVSRKMVTRDEFAKLIVALDKAFDGEYKLDRFNDFDHLLEDQAISSIAESKILHSTLVTALLGICDDYKNDSGLLLKIPDYYKNPDFVNDFSNTTWALDGELSRLAKGIKALGVSVNNLSVSDAEILKLAIDPKAENSKLSILLNSNIMTNTLSIELSNVDGLIIVDALYEDLFETVPQGLSNSEVIKKSEILDFFNSLYLIVGKEELEAGLSFNQCAEIVNIDYIKNKNLLNYSSLEPIMDSIIIETKISQTIVDEESIVVTKEFDFESAKDLNVYNWLSIDELGNAKSNGECKRILEILDKIEVIDIIASGSDGIDMNKFLNLSDEKIDLILTSDVIHATFIYEFYKKCETSGSVYIPTSYDLYVNGVKEPINKSNIQTHFDNLVIVKNNEIARLLKGIKYFNLDFNNLSVDPDILFTLDELVSDNTTKLDVIYQSDILWLTLSEQVLNQDGKVSIPYYSIKESRYGSSDRYITLLEVSNLIKSMDYLLIDSFSDEIDSDILINKDINLEGALESKILWNTISQKINDVEVLLKPTDAYTELDYLDNSGKYTLISKKEICDIQDVLINKLQVSSVKNIKTDDIFNSLDTNVKAGNDNFVNEICESYSIWYTISDKVFTSTDLVVPTIVNYQVSQSLYVQKLELSNLIKTAVNFGILSSVSSGAPISSESFDNKTRTELEMAFSSEIIHSTIILRFYEETDGEAGINLPRRYKLGVGLNELRSDLVSNVTKYNIYNDYEILNMLLGANELGMSFDNPSISTNDVLENDLNGSSSEVGKTKIDLLYESKIIWLTLSQRIINEDYLDVPIYEVLDNRFSFFDKLFDDERTIIKNEISNLIKSAKVLGIDDLTKEIDQYVIFEKEDVTYEDVTSSKIVWYTVSNKMFHDTTFQIPLDHIYKYVRASFDGDSKDYTYITEEELDALIYSCRMLDVDEDTIISANCVFDYDRNETNMVELCRSYIIWFTISRKMGEKSDTIKVPQHLKITEELQDEQGNPVTQVYIFKEELDSLVNSLYELIDPSPETGKRNIHEFNIDKYLDGSYTLDRWQHLWNDGQILWYTISDGIFNAQKLIISSNVVETISNAKFIKHNELERFMTAVNRLTPTNFESTNVEFSKILTSIDVLVESEIFSATISGEIIKGGQKVGYNHISVSYSYDDSNVEIYNIDNRDIIDFVNCASLVGMTDYDDIPTLNSEEDVIILSSSHILCMTYNSDIDYFVRLYELTNPDDVNEVYTDIEILYYDTLNEQFTKDLVNILSEDSILEFAKVKTA